MKARQSNATDPPTEEHELTDASKEWVVVHSVTWPRPEEGKRLVWYSTRFNDER